MKKHIILLAALGLFGCEKETAVGTASPQQPQHVSHARLTDWRKFYWDCQGQQGCPNPSPVCLPEPGNCLPDIVVHRMALADLNSAIAANRQKEFFASNEYAEIFGVENADEIQQGLASGNYKFVIYPYGDMTYYLVEPYNVGDSWETRFQNEELVIPCSVTE